MNDAENTRDTIAALLREPQVWHPEEIAALAETYAAACRAANERLQRCAQYLSRGMRSEAVHLAACPPDLIRLAASLRLEDASGWETLCLSYGQPRPPRPRIDLAECLSGAVQEDRRLAPLLERLRLLTFSHAALADRVAALRALHAADAQNPAWAEGLRLLEPERLQQLRTEVDLAAAEGDEPALAAAVTELESPEWLTPPEDRLLQSARDRLAALRRVRGLAELPLAELMAAYELKDYDRCAAVLDRWRDVRDRHQLTLPDDLQQKVRPVVTWLAAESRRRTLAQRRDLATAVSEPDAAAPQPTRRWWWPFP